MREKSASQIKATDLGYLGDPDESDPDEFNCGFAFGSLREWLADQLWVEVTVTAGQQEVPVAWPEEITPAPTSCGKPEFYPTSLEDTLILCGLKGGSISTTGITVVLSSDNHSGGKLRVPVPW